MAAVTHAHYIRTIHTSFTASASASSQYLNQVHYQHPQSQSQSLSINTHNTHMYTHHLRDLAPYEPAAHRTRRRSLSIRMPPSSSYTHKFDPFADEPITPLPSLPSPSPSALSQAQGVDPPTIQSPPYTIQIPAAQQVDIQLYTTTSTPPALAIPIPRTPRLAAASLPPPLPTTTGTGKQSRPLSPRAQTFTPRSSSISPPPALSSSLSPPLQTNTAITTPTAPSPALQEKAEMPPAPKQAQNPNLSKVVANILLNRVSSGGRRAPTGLMRRRALAGGREGRGGGQGQGQQGYVKSCLSSVVFVEAL